MATLMDSNVEFIAADNPHANRLTVHILAAVAEHDKVVATCRGTKPNQAANSRHKTNAARVIMETDHEKGQYARDYRWSRVADCDAPLASMVSKGCIAFR
jgi:hypothetical protein